MKFSDIARGTRSDEPIELPKFDGQAEDAPATVARVRALNGIEEEQALSAARKRAITQGISEPRAGEPLFDLALMVETIAIAVLDPESKEGARSLFFDGGGEQIRQWYGREAIALIYELQQEYQDRVAPTSKTVSTLEYFNGILVLGGEDEERARRFFYLCRPGLRWNFMRSTALQQVNSLTPKSEPGSSSATPSN